MYFFAWVNVHFGFQQSINTDAEILVVEIMLKHNQKITLMVFYRPPNNELHSLEELQRVIDEISTPEYIIVGDFNVSTINWANISPSPPSPVSMLLVDIVQDNFLSQLVSEPTRDKNILDRKLAVRKKQTPRG